MKRLYQTFICVVVVAIMGLFTFGCQKESSTEHSASKSMSAAPSRTLDTLAFMQKMHNDAMEYLQEALQEEIENGCTEITQNIVKTHLIAFAEGYDYSRLKRSGFHFESDQVLKQRVKNAIAQNLSSAFESAELTSQGSVLKNQIVVLPASVTLNTRQKNVKLKIETAILQSSNHEEVAEKAQQLLATASANDAMTAVLLLNSANMLVASNQHWKVAIPAWEEMSYMMIPANKGKRTTWKKVGNVVAADAVGALIGFFAGGIWGSIGAAIVFSAAAAATEVVVSLT